MKSARSAASERARGRLYLGLSIVILIFFNSGSDWMRAEKGHIRGGGDLVTRGFVWPPWRALQLYVSHDSDEHLFFEYTKLILGEPADLHYIAAANLGDTAAIEEQLRQKFAARPGGHSPYRYIAVGYPPVGLLVLLLPRLVTSTLHGYRLVFGALMSALFLGTMALGWRLARRGGSGLTSAQWQKRTALLLFCVGPTLVMRYDIVPALLTAAVVAALGERRALLATAGLLLGVAAKLYPALLLPTWLALLLGFAGPARRTAWRMVAALGGAGAVIALALLVRGGAIPLWAERITFSVRPFQVESVPGALLALPGWPESLAPSFGSFNAQSTLASRMLPHWDLLITATALAVAALAYVWASRRRAASPEEQSRALGVWTLVALLLNLCVTKVLSAQYFIWCLPFAALVPGRRGRSILYGLAGLLFLTQLIYPTLYGALIGGSGLVFALVLGRNLMLCALGALGLAWLWRGELTGVPDRRPPLPAAPPIKEVP